MRSVLIVLRTPPVFCLDFWVHHTHRAHHRRFRFSGIGSQQVRVKAPYHPVKEERQALSVESSEHHREIESHTPGGADRNAESAHPGMVQFSPAHRGQEDLWVDRSSHLANAVEMGQTPSPELGSKLGEEEILPQSLSAQVDLHSREREGTETSASLGHPDQTTCQGHQSSPSVRPEMDALLRRKKRKPTFRETGKKKIKAAKAFFGIPGTPETM